jgi:opacity protein-like surface antigen
MKKILIISVLLFCVLSINSQDVPTFSLGLYGGVFLTPQDFPFSPETGFHISADGEFRWKSTSVYAEFGYNQGTKTDASQEEAITNSEVELLSNPNVRVIEFSGGPRWYIGDGRLNGFAEGGLGFYHIGADAYSYKSNNQIYAIQEHSSGNIGLNIGAGANYSASKNIDFCLKAKLQYIATSGGESYTTIALGFRYKFR